MTAYEILDLRATLMERFVARVNFWLTATFAVFGAAHLAGDGLDIFSRILLVLFYLAITYLSWVGCTQTGARHQALTQDAKALLQSGDKELRIIAMEEKKPVNYAIMPIQNFLFWGGFAAFVIYVVFLPA